MGPTEVDRCIVRSEDIDTLLLYTYLHTAIELKC
jgi:hypothetical protein